LGKRADDDREACPAWATVPMTIETLAQPAQTLPDACERLAQTLENGINYHFL
jgi:hypothetical protein